MKTIDDIIVVGTDTGVGKSVISLLLMQLFFAKGYQPFYLKPFQTGCKTPYDKDSDARFVYAYTAALENQDPAQSMIYCHPSPKAPYYAARAADDNIGLAAVRRRIAGHRKQHAPLVVEAAGGLLVPVTDDRMMVDLIAMFACRPLLVARPGLGTINHTLLSIESMRQREIEPLGVVFVETSETPTDPQLVAENKQAIYRGARVAVWGVVGYLCDFFAPPAAAYLPLEHLFS